ncbi:MAG: copper amine oxidase N-terminal domain-containing protein [Clostridiales bacterium]|nr:copper amine oxidase N-terminal domain-containing protein [Clostridiales bacterium]
MRNFLLLITFTLSLSMVFILNIFANDINVQNIDSDVFAVNSTEQTKWYDSKWYEWYNKLPSEIQKNVSLPEFCDFEIQNHKWFEWYNQLSPEDQKEIKVLDFQQWNEQTPKWLMWFSSLPLEEQIEIDLQHIRYWFDRYNSSPLKWQKASSATWGFPVIQNKIYGIDTIKGTFTKVDYEWFDWFNLLTIEEQRKIDFRPEKFAAIQRDMYLLDNLDKYTYISVDTDPPLVLYSYVSYLDLCQKYIPRALDKIYRIGLYEEGRPVEYANEPFIVTFDLSESNISPVNFNSLCGVLYNGDEAKEYINGTYNQDTKIFTFYINKSGDYSVIINKSNDYGINTLNNTTQLKLTAGGVSYIELTIGSSSYTVNNEPKIFDTPPVIVDYRTLVPVRSISECFGAQVEWHEDTKTAAIIYKGKTLELTIGQLSPGMDVPAQIINNRTMAPLRYISETFGADVSYDEESKSITIELILD